MKVGLSTYSLFGLIKSGEMNVLDAIQWIAAHGGEHVELCPAGYSFTDDPTLIGAVTQKAREVGLDISSYTIGANFIQETEERYEAEIERVIKEVDIAGKLGVKLMRHDAGSRPPEEATVKNFESDLPRLAAACRRIADHARQYGITTNVENHGFHVQGSERVQRLVLSVNRDNFRTLVDVGNFLCVDEDPVAAVQNNIRFASFVHLKDFYVRQRAPSDNWLRTTHGNYLRGAIVGLGDLDIPRIIKIIKDSGYDGYLSIEFEGWEDCRLGSRLGMANIRKIWNEG